MPKTKGRPSRRGAGTSRTRASMSCSSSEDVDINLDFNFQLGIHLSLAMTKAPQQTKTPKRTRSQRNKQKSTSLRKVPSTPRRNKNVNTSIIDLDDSDDEYVPFAESKSKNISESIKGKVDTFFRSGGLLSDDEDEPFVSVDIKSNGSMQNTDSSNVCPSFSSVVTGANDRAIVIEDDTSGINTLEDIENYCKETEDLLKNANALLEKFTGSSNNELQSIKSEATEKETGRQEKGLGECPICYDKLSEKQVMSTKCGHLFCKDCIGKVAATVKKCPTCRKAVNKKNIIPIYI